MITLRTVARKANVSVSTVSRALNDSFDVSPETRAHVLRVAEECGYFLEKKRIRQENRRQGIRRAAILCPEIESPFYSGIVASLTCCLRGIGAQSVIYDFRFDRELFRSLLHQCRDQSDIDVIFCLQSPDEPIESSTPVISVGKSDFCPHVAVRQAEKYTLMAEHLYALGFRRVAFLGEQKTASAGEAFCEKARRRGMSVTSFESSQRFEAAGQEGGAYFLSQPQWPDAVVCAYDEIAYGLLEYFHQRGVSVPGQIAVAGLNGVSASAYCFGGLTTVETHYGAVFEQILRDLTEPGRGLQPCYPVQPELQVRYTTKGGKLYGNDPSR